MRASAKDGNHGIPQRTFSLKLISERILMIGHMPLLFCFQTTTLYKSTVLYVLQRSRYPMTISQIEAMKESELKALVVLSCGQVI